MFENWDNRRIDSTRRKNSFKTTLEAINPLDENEKVPVYFANFVLMD